MIILYDTGVCLIQRKTVITADEKAAANIRNSVGRNVTRDEAFKGTISYGILEGAQPRGWLGNAVEL